MLCGTISLSTDSSHRPKMRFSYQSICENDGDYCQIMNESYGSLHTESFDSEV